MPRITSLKSRILDKKDREILMILQDDGRESLTSIAKKVGLSIDSVNNRIKEMQNKGIFYFGIFVNPRIVGYPFVVEVRIKLRNITDKDKNSFINHLRQNPRVIDLFSTIGDTDITCVLVAKDANELDKISTEIRNTYANIIADWKGLLVLKTHKLERYDLE